MLRICFKEYCIVYDKYNRMPFEIILISIQSINFCRRCFHEWSLSLRCAAQKYCRYTNVSFFKSIITKLFSRSFDGKRHYQRCYHQQIRVNVRQSPCVASIFSKLRRILRNITSSILQCFYFTF